MTAVTDLRDQLPAGRPRIVLAVPSDVHAALARLRRENHHTQGTLATYAGVHLVQISDWETASKRPNLASLIKVADALGYRLALIPMEDA